ncbi:unnamed protein product [Acidocella sp. C78]|uniref:HlyD family secretion protein n=1 Tax=Acidocella sp. C78 TaxID=1671486 RepID=UPI00191BAC15|nr:HlyD family secretion protein [Acidocella sp. C78]CAG4918106.1 unnamed protein product [Acidocella sp. C78]
MSHTSTAAGPVAREAETREEATRGRRSGRMLRPLLMIGGVAVILGAILVYWLVSGGTVSVTDTYVQAGKVALSTDVSGLVETIDVHDNEKVKKGQVLFTLDPSRFEVAIAQAKANLAEVSQQVEATRAGYRAEIAKIRTQQSVVDNDRLNFKRYAALVHTGGVTRTAYDDAKYKLQGDEATLDAMTAQAGVDLAKLSGDPKIKAQDTPQYKAAKAALATAELNYRHSIVRAPFAGVVTETDKLRPGMFLPAGTAAFALVSNTDIWIRSQPKETSLTWVKPGDKVSVHVDTYPGRTWQGVVASIAPASGSSFSILPAENSSGNWVKVVQRIPLRVNIIGGPKNLVLRNGMTAEITIHTGHQNRLSDLF